MIIKLNDYISYIKATNNPLSSDVGIINGEDFIYLFDVGCSDVVFNEINNLNKKVKVIISHFHQDHIGNIHRLNYDLFVSKFTKKYTNRGIIVEDKIEIKDGNINLIIQNLPSSHSKGCLILTVNKEYTFIGDASYSTYVKGKIIYNVQKLKQTILDLEKIDTKYFLLSHSEQFIYSKEEVIKELKEIYNYRDINNQNIEIND